MMENKTANPDEWLKINKPDPNVDPVTGRRKLNQSHFKHNRAMRRARDKFNIAVEAYPNRRQYERRDLRAVSEAGFAYRTAYLATLGYSYDGSILVEEKKDA